jgi:CBS domain containing-hemolysin-like protein
MLLDIAFTIFLVLLNGFFVAAEFAIVKVRMSQIEIKANQGSSLAKISKSIVENLDSYLSATQLGITLASLGLGWIGESVVSQIVIHLIHLMGYEVSLKTAHEISLPIAFLLITVLHIVFGELAPKSIAIRHPLNTTIALSMPLQIFYWVFRPVIWFLNILANFILRIIGITLVHGQNIHTEEELRIILTESEEGGAIKHSEHELIQNVFEFDDRIVKQIYVPRTQISAINIDMSNDEIINKVLEEGYSRLPVYRDTLDNIVGIIYNKDLLKVIKHQDSQGIKDIIRPAYFVPMNKRVNDLLRELQRQHIQMAIVTNEFGATSGIITMEDIIEELVGEIQDEYDEEKPSVEKKSDTEYIVAALSSISDVNALLPVPLPESEQYETVSGLINVIFGRIPAVGEKKVFANYEVSIVKRFKHSVEQVRLVVFDPVKK